MSDQKRWEAEKARQAPELRDEYIESLVEDVASASHSQHSEAQPEQEMTEEEYILAQEEYELQALIAAMEEEQNQQDSTSQHYGSDDEDYDQIFRECMADDVARETSSDARHAFLDPDAMDMTDG